MKKAFWAAAAIALSLSATSTLAADLPSMKGPPPAYIPPPPVMTWTGLYVGVNAGYAWGESNLTTQSTFSPVGYFATTSIPAIAAVGNQFANSDGFTGGGQIGYNYQYGNFVVGLEADFQYYGLRGSANGAGIYPCCAPTGFNIASKVSTDWLFTARPRIGYAWNNWLVYATGGLALTELKSNYLFSDTFATAFESASISDTRVGWAVGGGVEYAFAGPWSVKLEYLHTEFDNVSVGSANLIAFTPPIPFPMNPWVHTVNLKSNLVRAGLNYKLNLFGGAPILAKY
jgi:outer membrane immunogenic protein